MIKYTLFRYFQKLRYFQKSNYFSVKGLMSRFDYSYLNGNFEERKKERKKER